MQEEAYPEILHSSELFTEYKYGCRVDWTIIMYRREIVILYIFDFNMQFACGESCKGSNWFTVNC